MTRRRVLIGLAVLGGTVVAAAGGLVVFLAWVMDAVDRAEEEMWRE